MIYLVIRRCHIRILIDFLLLRYPIDCGGWVARLPRTTSEVVKITASPADIHKSGRGTPTPPPAKRVNSGCLRVTRCSYILTHDQTYLIM